MSYAHGHHESVLRSHRWRTVDNSAAYLLPHLHPGQRVLDVGCGPGNLTAEIAGRVAPGRVAGIDASAEIIAQAATEHGAVAEFAVGDVYALAAADATFDVVHAHQVLQHLDDPVAALGEMRRVTRRDGVVAARDADYGGMTWAPSSAALDRWMEIYQAITSAMGHDADAGRHLLGWGRAAGFAEVTATASVWCFADPDSRRWWASLWADRVRQSSYRTHAVEQGLADDAELAEIAAGWQAWAEDPDGVFVCPHGEIVARG